MQEGLLNIADFGNKNDFSVRERNAIIGYKKVERKAEKGMRIAAKKMLVNGEWIENRVAVIENGVITAIEPGTQGDVYAQALTPGLFDKHQHGGEGFDCSHPTLEGVKKWLLLLARHGVTNVMYSISTGSIDVTRKAVAFCKEVMALQAKGELPGARVMGVHFEGPFINVKKKGAMAEEYALAPTMENFQALAGEDADIVHLVAMAPELPGAIELAKELVARGIRVQACHTDTDYATMAAAADAGFTGLTHTFNAMNGIHHRAPGPVVAGLLDDRLYLEAICDFVHLAPEIVELLFRFKGAKGITMVSDSVRTAGLPDGEYHEGNYVVVVKDGRNFTTTGGIAGSYQQLDCGVTDVVSLGYDLSVAIEAASTSPARHLGMEDQIGTIAVGRAAWMAMWDENAVCKGSVVGDDVFFA